MKKFWFVFYLAMSMALMSCGSTSHFRVSTDAYRLDPETQKPALSTRYGSGFFINSTGLALTSAHIFRGRVPHTGQAYVWWGGGKDGLSATPVVIDWNMDLALVQVATHRSTPVKPLCTEVVSGSRATARGAPEYKVLRERGVIFGVFVEESPCETREEDGGIGVRCASEKPFIHTSGVQWSQLSSGAPAVIVETTANIRSGYSGGSLLHKTKGKKACTVGVIIQQYETGHRRARAIYPLSSLAITQYLNKHAPEFVENFSN